MISGRGPDFVGIGAQKAGTTWLYDNLRVQPALWMPPVKEIHFFNRVCPHESLLGVEVRGRPGFVERYRPLLERPTLGRLRWIRRFHNEPPSTEWYRSLFPPQRVQGRLAGDITPAYSTLDERGVAFARRVLEPGCRVFVVVRNPIERAWSALKMLHRWTGTDVATADVDAIIAESDAPSHRLQGDYTRTIRLWREAFGEDFAVFRYDRLVAGPESFLRSVLDFIGFQGQVDLGNLGLRSNADPAREKMPEKVLRHLRETYRPSIEELDLLVPGIASEWLSRR